MDNNSADHRPEGARVSTNVIRRGRTAIRRNRSSKPVALALADGMIAPTTSVFDYGCGHGADVQYLRSKRIRVQGWDPHYRPDVNVSSADVVNLGYVLNVIEDQQERLETLRRAFQLARKVLLVAVRVDRALEEGLEFADGRITGAGTFQKIFDQEEFREYLELALGRHVYLVAPGIAYVFAEDSVEAQFLATRAFARRLEYRTDLIEQFSKSRAARSFVALTNRLGRVPAPEEFSRYGELLQTFGSFTRIERLTLRLVNREAFEGSRDQRRQDLLTYLAMLRLQGLPSPKFTDLPPTLRNDVRGIWGSYRGAAAESEAFLFAMGKPDQIRTECNVAAVGKLLPENLYVHRTAEDDLPALLRLVVFTAKQVVGEVSYDLVKLRIDGRAVSFLSYSSFDFEAHPRLLRSLRVYLPKARFAVRDYSATANPPILHRKDSFVTKDYPHFDKFRRLTEQEEAAGLLGLPDIGLKEAWENFLRVRGLVVVDHSLQLCANAG